MIKVLAAVVPLASIAAAQATQTGQQPAGPSPTSLARVEVDADMTGWKAICAGTAVASSEDLERAARAHHRQMRRSAQPIGTPLQRTGSFDIVFQVPVGFPAEAAAALAACEPYIESFFSDPITITIDCSFQPASFFPAGVIGGSQPVTVPVPYSTARPQIVNDMDSNDTIHSFLPLGNGFLVQYLYISFTLVFPPRGATLIAVPRWNEDRVWFTRANWKAVNGPDPGTDGHIAFRQGVNFDYDPSDGLNPSSHSFRDVVMHEVGHVLGFFSAGDIPEFAFDSMMMDLFRFNRTDGQGDRNPDTLAEFQTHSRLVIKNRPNDDHNLDLITVEYRMSDGSPHQMMHFREQTPRIGMMDAKLLINETHWPNYYTGADLTVFDVIGYDR